MAIAALTVTSAVGCSTSQSVDPLHSQSMASLSRTASPVSTPTSSATQTATPLVSSSPSVNKMVINAGAGTGISSVQFQFSGNYSITSSEASSWGGVSYEPITPLGNTNGGGTVLVTANRSHSAPPAQFLQSNTTLAICTNSTAGGSSACRDQWPSDLNFAFTGTLIINGTNSYPVAIGQGNVSGVNNWWLGGPGFQIPTVTDYDMTTPDKKFAISRTNGGGQDYTWFVQAI